MVGTNTFVLASVLAVLISVSKVDAAFKCYSCDSVTDSGCSDKFSASSAFESPATCRGCSMVKLYGVVTRACLIQSLGNTCEESGENAACYCESELCNGSNTLAISTATLIYASLARKREIVRERERQRARERERERVREMEGGREEGREGSNTLD
ncbi:hypothetical protein DPMN_068637 [Dreissena polymorpha]|uniref:Protein sleepless n=1 Tax=Dreissena polymorpha TaxID=45954 RepID=A0A9D4BTR6_DREPO|nr:hypothetical protein DPMN_068637 [Dreissena polymorpha]